MKKTVAIIGAGPSGLVAAKTLLRSQRCRFDVSVFEKKSTVGGLWAVDRNDGDPSQLLNANMPTNASRFTVSFSDFAWSSVDLTDPNRDRPQPSAPDGSPFVPMFPKAWQVQKYLQQYTKRYIPESVIFFNRTVTSTERVKSDVGSPAWKIKWRDAEGVSSGVFDYLIVASGFFSEPRLPQADLMSQHGGVKQVHSSKLRKLKDVAPEDPSASGTILIVGGAMSGGEAASALAFDLSDAEHAPGSKARSGLKIVQVVPRPFYALPPIVPYQDSDSNAPKFFTLDLTFYDLTKRPPGPVNPGEGRQPPEISNFSHNSLRTLTGGDQSEYSSPAVVAGDVYRPAFAAIQEWYPEFLRSGAVRAIPGRVEIIDRTEKQLSGPLDSLRATIIHDGKQDVIDDVVGIVYATGFKPTAALEHFSSDVKKTLEYDPECHRLPFLLGEESVLAPNVDHLAFVGFYEGPFWAAMEKQAEFIADTWGKSSAQGEGLHSEDLEVNRIEKLRDLRKAMLANEKDVPQYWMGDYVGIIEKLARKGGVTRNEVGLEPRTGPVFGSRYVSSFGDATEAQKLLDDLQQVRTDALQKGRFVARAAFRAMQGNWKIRRQLDSRLPEYPSGELIGIASFHPRRPTDGSYDAEYLYVESGTLKTQQGLSMQASRRFAYRYQELTDQITVWFVKEDGKTVDYLYNDLLFDHNPVDAWTAKSDHLCIADMYRSEYTFRFRGMHLRDFAIKHAVKGPKKDYISDTLYER
ncbi:hypothetical protein FH972_020998 [Carpinus fangiana]|uniref:Flavin-containing monooxygenase n=1 Tax=Carpinus fangiana TaxID=176857 RepID=A0A5N6KQ56_9ROSI|nr:hypothetical protein FH972_020998 [Carpinus fangiana]